MFTPAVEQSNPPAIIPISVIKFITKIFSDFLADRCTTMSAALAYYTVFALPPLMYLLLVVLTAGLSVAYENDQAEQQAESILRQQAAQILGNDTAAEEVNRIIEMDRMNGGKWWKTLISFVGILIGATGVVAAIQDSLNRVWSVKPDPSGSGVVNLLIKRLLSLAMILGLGFLLLVSLIISAALAELGSRITDWIGMDREVAVITDYTLQGLVTFTVFAAIFKFMPDAEIRYRDVAVGALVTSLLFLVGRTGLQWYLAHSDPAAQLGSAAASLAAILVWVYYSSMIFFLGAEVTQAYAMRFGGGIVPQENAVRVIEKTTHSSQPPECDD